MQTVFLTTGSLYKLTKVDHRPDNNDDGRYLGIRRSAEIIQSADTEGSKTSVAVACCSTEFSNTAACVEFARSTGLWSSVTDQRGGRTSATTTTTTAARRNAVFTPN